MNTSAEMPKYKCHKVVRALKIKAAIIRDSGMTIVFEDDAFDSIDTTNEIASKFYFKDINGKSDLGYYVEYEDGYFSWSPTKAFEEGYTKLKDQKTVDIIFEIRPAERVMGDAVDDFVFVEVEDGNGRSIRHGEWIKGEDGYMILRVPA